MKHKLVPACNKFSFLFLTLNKILKRSDVFVKSSRICKKIIELTNLMVLAKLLEMANEGTAAQILSVIFSSSTGSKGIHLCKILYRL